MPLAAKRNTCKPRHFVILVNLVFLVILVNAYIQTSAVELLFASGRWSLGDVSRKAK